MPATQARDHFSLRHLERALDGFTVPTGPFDPAGAWSQRWELFEYGFRLNRHGALRLDRAPLADGARLTVALRKFRVGGTLRCEGEVECAADALATVRRWRLATVALDPAGQEVPGTRLAESGERRGDELLIRGPAGERRVAVRGPVTCDFSLFDAVQRLPAGEPAQGLTFSLLDRLARRLKPGQSLVRGEAATLELGGRRVWREQATPLAAGTVYRPVTAIEGAVSVNLTAREQVGPGVLPTTWWTDAQGRLLVMTAGLIGWVANPAAQV